MRFRGGCQELFFEMVGPPRDSTANSDGGNQRVIITPMALRNVTLLLKDPR